MNDERGCAPLCRALRAGLLLALAGAGSLDAAAQVTPVRYQLCEVQAPVRRKICSIRLEITNKVGAASAAVDLRKGASSRGSEPNGLRRAKHCLPGGERPRMRSGASPSPSRAVRRSSSAVASAAWSSRRPRPPVSPVHARDQQRSHRRVRRLVRKPVAPGDGADPGDPRALRPWLHSRRQDGGRRRRPWGHPDR